MDMVPICYIADDGYVVPTATSIASLINFKRENTRYSIKVITNNMTEANRRRIEGMSCPGAEIEVVRLEPEEELERLASGNAHVTSTALYKFSLPNIFPECEKMLYLDGDILARKDLSQLLEVDLGDNYVAAVKDYRAIVSEPNPLDYLPLASSCYFNSGVMLLNLKKIRSDGIREQLIDYRLHGVNHFMDQDTLNVVFSGKVKYLPLTYNVMYSAVSHFSIGELVQYYEMGDLSSIDELCDIAFLWHYCSPTKPWKFLDSWKAKEWYECFRLSPFRDVVLDRKSRAGNSPTATKSVKVIKANEVGEIGKRRRGGALIKKLLDRARNLR